MKKNGRKGAQEKVVNINFFGDFLLIFMLVSPSTPTSIHLRYYFIFFQNENASAQHLKDIFLRGSS
jgi:hypothetical protein